MKNINLLLFIVFIFLYHSNGIQVLDFAECPEKLNLPLNMITEETISEMTVCLRFSMKYLTPSYLMNIGPLFSIYLRNFGQKFGFVRFDKIGRMFIWKNEILPEQWQHLCISYTEENSILVVLNGKLLHDDIVNLPDFYVSSKSLTESGLNLGSSVKVNHDRFYGKITELNIYDMDLGLETMIDFTTCKDIFTMPNIFEWNNLNMNSTNCYKLEERNSDEICYPRSDDKLILIEEAFNFDDSKYFCEALNGFVPLPKNLDEFNILISKLNESKSCFKSAFVGGTKVRENEIEDIFGNLVQFQKWTTNQPNGRNITTCIILKEWFSKFGYDDVDCLKPRCFFCIIKANQLMTIRGYFPRKMDRLYMINGKMEINGITRTPLKWKVESGFLVMSFSLMELRNYLL